VLLCTVVYYVWPGVSPRDLGPLPRIEIGVTAVPQPTVELLY
jgi:hypothetical protein